MTEKNTNLTMVRGDEYGVRFQALYNGDPMPLTGAELYFTAKWRFSDPDDEAVFQYTTADQIEVLDVDEGTFRVVVDPDDTVGLPARRTVLRYDVKVITATDRPYTLVRGNLIVEPNVSIVPPPAP